MNGAQVVAERLSRLGVEVVFTVSGNQSLPLLDALADVNIRVIHARHENGAVYMAEAWGRLRSHPGVCLLTAGPGQTSGLTALACARAAEAPVVCISAAAKLGWRGAFQEIDQPGLADRVCVDSRTIVSAREAATAVSAAWRAANDTVPGPAHLTIPVNVLSEEAEGGGPQAAVVGTTRTNMMANKTVEHVGKEIAKARHPLLLVRPSLGRAHHAAILRRLRHHLPTIVAESPRGLRDPALVDYRDEIAVADLLIAAGPLDFAVDFGLVGGTRRPRIILVTSRPEELIVGSSRVGPRDLLILSEEAAWLEALCQTLDQLPARRKGSTHRVLHKSNVDESEPLHPLVICRELRCFLGEGDLLVIDGGEFGQWIRAGLRDRIDSHLINGRFGAIGGSIPQAVGSAAALPHRRVVAFVGDGAFGYHASELDTAVREGLKLILIVGNDSRWSSEWYQQQETYGRVVATELEPRDYDLVAAGFGAWSTCVRSVRQLRTALETATSERTGVACLNVITRSLPISSLR